MSKPAAKARKPDPQGYTKWEKPLPYNLEDFMNQCVAWKREGVEHPEWKQKVVEELERDLTDMIRIHWKNSSKTRKLFIAMNKEEVWHDFKGLQMKLTKRNLATLDPNFQPEIQQHVLTVMTNLIETIRTEARTINEAVYPTDEDSAALLSKLEGNEQEDYSFEKYGEHLEIQKQVHKELKDKFAAIEYLRKREQFVQKLVHFEQKHANFNPSAKGGKNLNNWLPKWRLEASKILIKSFELAEKVMKDYEDASGKDFLLFGKDYRNDFLLKQKGQLAKVKTNFRHITDKELFFDNPRGGAEGGPIAERILDSAITHIAAEGTPELEPPAMPVHSDDVEFTFAYY